MKKESCKVKARRDLGDILVLPPFLKKEGRNYHKKKDLPSQVVAKLELELWSPDYCVLNSMKAMDQKNKKYEGQSGFQTMSQLTLQPLSWPSLVPYGWAHVISFLKISKA